MFLDKYLSYSAEIYLCLPRMAGTSISSRSSPSLHSVVTTTAKSLKTAVKKGITAITHPFKKACHSIFSTRTSVNDSGRCQVHLLFYLIIQRLCIDKESEFSSRPPSLIDIDATEPSSEKEQETDEQELSTCASICLVLIHLFFKFLKNV